MFINSILLQENLYKQMNKKLKNHKKYLISHEHNKIVENGKVGNLDFKTRENYVALHIP